MANSVMTSVAVDHYRLLVIEDEVDIRRAVGGALREQHPAIIEASTGEAGVEAVDTSHPDLVILDLGLPDLDGLVVCQRIRAMTAAPIIVLTARHTESDTVALLNAGADDYITKPFSPKEVVARVKAVLRRFEQPLQKEIVKAGELVIDTAAMRVTTRGEQVVTTATEFRLIEFLATHPGRVFTRKALLDAVWHDTAFVTPRIVDVYIRRLREKIERDPERPRHIHTVRGAGYMFEVRK